MSLLDLRLKIDLNRFFLQNKKIDFPIRIALHRFFNSTDGIDFPIRFIAVFGFNPQILLDSNCN